MSDQTELSKKEAALRILDDMRDEIEAVIDKYSEMASVELDIPYLKTKMDGLKAEHEDRLEVIYRRYEMCKLSKSEMKEREWIDVVDYFNWCFRSVADFVLDVFSRETTKDRP